MDKLYTVEEVASALNVHINTIRIWLRKGTLKGIKLGKYWRVEENQLKDFVEKAKGVNPDNE